MSVDCFECLYRCHCLSFNPLWIVCNHISFSPCLMERFLVRKTAPQSEVQHQLMPIKTKEQGQGASLQGVTVALARDVSRILLSKFEHMSGPETNLTLITGRVGQMGLPCIVSGTCG